MLLELFIDRNLLPYEIATTSGTANNSILVRVVNGTERVSEIKLKIGPLEGHVFFGWACEILLSYLFGRKHSIPSLDTQDRLRARKRSRVSSIHVSHWRGIAR